MSTLPSLPPFCAFGEIAALLTSACSVPNLNGTGQKVGPDPVWHVGGIFSEGAGYSSVFSRPSYQNGVANITHSTMRSVPGDRMAVSISPGEMALTRMPRGPKSAAISRVSAASAAFEVA